MRRCALPLLQVPLAAAWAAAAGGGGGSGTRQGCTTTTPLCRWGGTPRVGLQSEPFVGREGAPGQPDASTRHPGLQACPHSICLTPFDAADGSLAALRAALPAIKCCCRCSPLSKSQDLTEDTFPEGDGDGWIWLIEFYAPWW